MDNTHRGLIEEIRSLKIENEQLRKRLEVAIKMNTIEGNQELATLKSGIAKAFRHDYEDFGSSKDKECNQELFKIYRVIISRMFKGLEKFGISFVKEGA